MALKICHNCMHTIEKNSIYCNNCGQKYSASLPTFSGLIKSSLGTIFGLDNRLFTTFKYILLPGRLPEQFIQGRRKAILPPGQLFLALSIIFFGLVQYGWDTSELDIGQGSLRSGQYLKTLNFLESYQDSSITATQKQIVDSASQIIATHHQHVDDSFTLNMMWLHKNVEIAYKDLHEKSPDQIFKDYNLSFNTLQSLLAKRLLRLQEDPRQLFTFAAGHSYWIIFLSIPLLAIILKLIYWRRKRYYIEHAVYLLYTHCSILFIVFGWWILDQAFGLPGLILSITIPLFVILSQLYFYKQSIIKSIIKILIFSIAYPFIMIVAAVFVFSVSMFLF